MPCEYRFEDVISRAGIKAREAVIGDDELTSRVYCTSECLQNISYNRAVFVSTRAYYSLLLTMAHGCTIRTHDGKVAVRHQVKVDVESACGCHSCVPYVVE